MTTTPPTCDVCAGPVYPMAGQTTADTVVCEFCINKAKSPGTVTVRGEDDHQPCQTCRGTGHEPYHNPHTGTTEYGPNELCANCDDCYGTGIAGFVPRTDPGDETLEWVDAPPGYYP